MTIKEEEKTKSFNLTSLLRKNAIYIAFGTLFAFAGFIIHHVESNNDAKWLNLKDNHPSIRIERRGESNLLTSTYTLIRIDGTRHISVQDGTNTGSSYSYRLSDIQIYEIIK